ncbi:hypothetical protein F4212_04965 [Candidatus Poribacteria bacterium]|nr:hypothetical protein [Candidatus Poribacteria bacterium]
MIYRVFRETSERRFLGVEGLVSVHRGDIDAIRAAKALAETERGERYYVLDERHVEIFSAGGQKRPVRIGLGNRPGRRLGLKKEEAKNLILQEWESWRIRNPQGGRLEGIWYLDFYGWLNEEREDLLDFNFKGSDQAQIVKNWISYREDERPW